MKYLKVNLNLQKNSFRRIFKWREVSYFLIVDKKS